MPIPEFNEIQAIPATLGMFKSVPIHDAAHLRVPPAQMRVQLGCGFGMPQTHRCKRHVVNDADNVLCDPLRQS